MAYIETIGPDDADGELKRLYDEATRRAGRVYGFDIARPAGRSC